MEQQAQLGQDERAPPMPIPRVARVGAEPARPAPPMQGVPRAATSCSSSSEPGRRLVGRDSTPAAAPRPGTSGTFWRNGERLGGR
eukprot:9855175-Heterocapsa_arctica.AAC.1